MRTNTGALAVAVAVAVLSAGCPTDRVQKAGADTGSEAATGADTDTESDTESDTDTDTESDTDTETDTDTDTDTDTNPVDGDGDGRDASEDCDDNDPEVYPGATELCEGGRDEDCDGLVDCEDADCIEATECTEDCTNGVDDDADGLIDCEQDSCIGVSPCAPIYSVRVHGGHVSLWETPRLSSFQWEISVQDLSGSVVAQLPGGGSGVCTFQSVSRTFEGSAPDSWATIRRTSPGVVTGSCGVGTSAFLPQGLQWARLDTAGFTVPGPAWPAGSSTRRATVTGWYGARSLTASTDTRTYSSAYGGHVWGSGYLNRSYQLGGSSPVEVYRE